MTHIRIDDDKTNLNRKFACGLTDLPLGDTYAYPDEDLADKADCPGCNPPPPPRGTPISQLSGRPGHPGYEEFRRIAGSWGYE